MRNVSTQVGIVILAFSLMVAACSAAPDGAGSSGDRDTAIENPEAPEAAPEAAPEVAGGCERDSTDVPWTSDVSATTVVLSDGGATAAHVEAVIYPHPEYDGNPWSQWGQGLVLDDGRYLSAIGDHRGPDGNSYLFEYDPATRTLTQISDVLGITDHTPGDWGFGKVHAQMVRGPCDNVMLSTYWGTRRDIEFTTGYRGDMLINIDPQRRTVGSRGVVQPDHGVPSLAASPDGQLLYAEAVDPLDDDDAGAFVVRNAVDGTTLFVDDDPAHIGYRSIAVDAEGKAFYSIGEGRLAVYDPRSNTRSELDARLPGEWLRAATEPDEQGIVYGVTRDPEVFFALHPDGSLETLGQALGYTTSVALSQDGTALYSIPEAHGQSWRIGAPLMAMDTSTGEQEVVVELQPLAEQHLGMRLGGTYNVAVDNKTIYIGMNASRTDDDTGFGDVVLITVTLP